MAYTWTTLQAVRMQSKILQLQIISLQILSQTFLNLRKIQWDTIINIHRPSCRKFQLFLYNFNQVWIWQIFKKSSNIKFHENPPSGSQAVPCEWTDRHDKADSHITQFCGCTKNKVHITWIILSTYCVCASVCPFLHLLAWFCIAQNYSKTNQ